MFRVRNRNSRHMVVKLRNALASFAGGYGLLACYLGFASAIAQVVMIREILSVFRGNEFIIGIIFSSWFFGIYLGARLSGRADRDVMISRVRRSLILLPCMLAVSVYAVHAMPAVISVIPGSFYSFSQEMFFSFIYTVPVSFLVGYVFPPLVTVLSVTEAETSGGTVYFIESLGSFMGGMAFSFVFVDMVNPLGMACILLGLVLIITYYGNRIMVSAVLALLVMAPFTGILEKSIMAGIWSINHTGKLVSHERSQYQILAAESHEEQVSFYGDGIHLYTLPDRYDARAVYHLIMACNRQGGGRVLLFGSGPGSVLYNLVKSGIDEVYYCETDARLWRMTSPYTRRFYPGLLEADNLRIITGDVKNFLSRSDVQFDCIVNLHSMPENILLNRYFTREFYAQCREHLRAGGVMIAAVRGFSNYLSAELREFIVSIYKSFSMEFPRVMVTSGEEMIMMGSEHPSFPSSGSELIRRYQSRIGHIRDYPLEKEVIRGFNPLELSMLFEKTQLEYLDEAVQSSIADIQVNSDSRPRGYWNHIILSSFQEESLLYGILKDFCYVPLLVLVFTVLALADILFRRSRRVFREGLIMYLVGFVSISTVMLLIILYQNHNGTVYYRMSLISALFMLGLTLGSYVSNRAGSMRPVYVFPLMIASLAMVYVFFKVHWNVLFWIVLVIFAFFSGTVFPLLYRFSTGDYGLRASVLDSMDHFGSIAGSLVIVLFLLPFAGITGTIVIEALLLFLAMVVSMPYRRGSVKN